MYCDCVAMQAALNAVAATAAVVRVTAFGSCDNPLDEHVDGRLGAGCLLLFGVMISFPYNDTRMLSNRIVTARWSIYYRTATHPYV